MRIGILTAGGDCPGINAQAQNGQMWQASINEDVTTWKEYTGEIVAD